MQFHAQAQLDSPTHSHVLLLLPSRYGSHVVPCHFPTTSLSFVLLPCTVLPCTAAVPSACPIPALPAWYPYLALIFVDSGIHLELCQVAHGLFSFVLSCPAPQDILTLL